MGIVIIAVLATFFGGVLIFLLVLAGPNPAAIAREGQAPGDGSGEAYLASLSAADLGRLLQLLLEAMGLEVHPLSEPEDGALLLAVDPKPITGVRMLVWGLPGTAPAPDAETVRSHLELVRGEEVGKGLLVVAGPATREAIDACEDSPVELLAGTELWKLVEKKLPGVARERRLRTSELD